MWESRPVRPVRQAQGTQAPLGYAPIRQAQGKRGKRGRPRGDSPVHRRLVCVLTIVAALPLLTVSVPLQAAPAARPKAIILVLHGVSWEELAAADVPPLPALLRRAAVGVMNSRRLDWPDDFGAYVTIGAGRGAVSTVAPQERSFISSGWPGAMHGGGIEAVRDANLRAHTQAEPGLLGTVLRMNGKVTGLLETDAVMGIPRMAQAIAMDRNGVTDRYEHGSFRWPERPGDPLRRMIAECDLVVMDFTSFHRLAFRQDEPPPVPGKPDAKALQILRSLYFDLNAIVRLADPARDLLILTSPTCPPYKSPKDMSYAPIAVIGPGFGPGLLTSASSRRRGMVSNVDIAPTVLQFFGIDVPGPNGRSGAPTTSGRPMTTLPAREPLRDVLAISRQGVRLVQLQYRFAPVYALGEFFAFLGAGLALAFAPACALRSRRRLRILLLLAMSLPLALLFLGPFDPGGLVQPYIIVAALAGALTWLSWREEAPLSSMAALLSVTAGIVVLDALTGSHLLHNSIINFGALATRMYGIHNETMGFVAACAAVGGAGLVQALGKTRWSLLSLGLWFALVTAVIAAPFWGANFGGGITAAFAFAVTYLGIRAGRPRLRHWAAAIVPAIAVGALVVAMDLLGSSRTWTHMGDSARLVSAGGMHAAADIIARKAALAWHVMRTIPALSITVALCILGTGLVLKPPVRLRAALEAYPSLWPGLAGGFAGAAMGIIANDSGLVAASSAIGITASAMAYVALGSNGGGND